MQNYAEICVQGCFGSESSALIRFGSESFHPWVDFGLGRFGQFWWVGSA